MNTSSPQDYIGKIVKIRLLYINDFNSIIYDIIKAEMREIKVLT